MRRSTLIIGIAVVLVLAGGIALLSFWPEAGVETEEPTPSLPTETFFADLVNVSRDEVAEIVFHPTGGSPYTLLPVIDSEENDVLLSAANAIFPGDQFMLQSTFFFASILRNLYIITDNADDTQLALFGLDDPVMTWQIKKNDGTIIEAIVGAQQAAGENRYVSLKNSREVFLISDTQSFSLTRDLEDMYDLSFFPYPPSTEEMPTWTVIDHVLLEMDGTVIELRQRSYEELENTTGIGISAVQLLQPFVGEGNDYVVQSDIFEPITEIIPSRVVEKHPKDLSVYGLDNPSRLTVTSDDWKETLLIGGRDLENNGRFVMIEGYDAVLLDLNGDYSFLNVTPARLRGQLMWLFDITTISSVDFELDGITRKLVFEHDADNSSLRGWLDDKEIKEINARRLYIGVLSITQAGTTEAAIPNIDPSYRLTINVDDGSSQVLELYRLSDSQFLIVINDTNTGFFITRMLLQQNLLNRFDLLDAGRDIP